MRQARYVAHKEEKNMHTGFWWGNLREKDHLQYHGTDGRTLLNGLHIFPFICGVRYKQYLIKSRRMRQARYVAHTEEKNVHTGFWWGNVREKDHLQYHGTDGRTILTLR